MERNNRGESHQNIGMYIFECTMSLMYLAMSFVLLFTKLFEDSISDKSIRLGLGILLGFYGFFRVYRAIKKFLKRDNPEVR